MENGDDPLLAQQPIKDLGYDPVGKLAFNWRRDVARPTKILYNSVNNVSKLARDRSSDE